MRLFPSIPVAMMAFLCSLTAARADALPGASPATLGPELQERIATARPGEVIPVMVQLGLRNDLSRHPSGKQFAPAVIRDLQATAEAGQRVLRDFLRARQLESSSRFFWIVDAVSVRADRDLVAEISRLPGVERIDLDVPVLFPETEPSRPGERTPEWNIQMVGGDLAWSLLGLDGSGVVVANMDTGIDIDHPALAGKWRGGDNSWIDLVGGQPAPYDDHGHGTHTMGTMVGGDGPGPFPDDVGLAYGATFIAAKVLDASNSFSSASIVIAGAQWILDPDGDPDTNDFPDVVSNSWYFNSQTYTGFYDAAAAWRAVGIVPVFCIGNFGPAFSTTRPPGSYDNVIGVGATTSVDAIWSGSSRGPSPSGLHFPSDLRKPDLSAPGHLVRSSVPGGGYEAWSGTSMATPHVAAAIALALQGSPGLSYAEILSRLEANAADRGQAGYDYAFGYGRLDVYATLTQSTGLPAAGLGPAATGISVRPNPHSSEVRLGLPGTAGEGSVRIFDAGGRLVRSLAAGGGEGVVRWDGRDEAERVLPAGTYFARWRGAGDEREATLVRIR